MSSSCVTLAEVLQLKGNPLEEEEIWALLHLATENLLQDLPKGEWMVYVLVALHLPAYTGHSGTFILF